MCIHPKNLNFFIIGKAIKKMFFNILNQSIDDENALVSLADWFLF